MDGGWPIDRRVIERDDPQREMDRQPTGEEANRSYFRTMHGPTEQGSPRSDPVVETVGVEGRYPGVRIGGSPLVKQSPQEVIE